MNIYQTIANKTEILQRGIVIEQSAYGAVAQAKQLVSARSGASGGLDLRLPDGVFVNAFPHPGSDESDRPRLLFEAGVLCVRMERRAPIPVELLPEPAFYSRRSLEGVDMVKIGQMCSGDRVCIGVSRSCYFERAGVGCDFCGVGANTETDAVHKSVDAIAEVVEAAVHDPLLPAKHVLLGGGTMAALDRGSSHLAEIASVIKAVVPVSVYVMLPPPEDLGALKLLADAGVDEVGLNMELFDERLLRQYAPAKADIGRQRYLRALETLVDLIGPVNTRSALVVGLESADSTLRGVEELSKRGVMPILSPFRPLRGSAMAGREAADPVFCAEVFVRALDITAKYEVPLGPTCIPCQNNVLALPLERPPYRYYGEDETGG